MAKKKKYYVVWSGIKPGVYLTWDECKAQVLAVEGAKYKSYESLTQAENEYRLGYKAPIKKNTISLSTAPISRAQIILPSLSVDAACSGNPGLMEYRGIDNQSKQELFLKGPFKDGTNNIGEFLAIVHALAMLKKKGFNNMPIYSDSVTAMGWVKKKKANTKLEVTAHNEELFDLIERAEIWLKENQYNNPIYKWETKRWGENPADFGRK